MTTPSERSTPTPFQYTSDKISTIMEKFSPTLRKNIIFSAIGMDKNKFLNSLEVSILVFSIEEIDNYHFKDMSSKKSRSVIMLSSDFDKEIRALTERDTKKEEENILNDIKSFFSKKAV